MNSRDSFVTRPDGLKLCARKWGSDECRLVLVHGFGLGSYVWNHVAPQLTEHGGVLAFDLRGHGDSDPDPAGQYSVASHAVDLLCVMQHFDLRDVVLVGHSLGALVVTEAGVLEAARVRALVLVDGGPDLNEDAISHILKMFDSQRWTYREIGDYLADLEKTYPIAHPSLLARLAPHALRPAPDGSFDLKCDIRLKETHRAHDDSRSWAALRALVQPLLVLRGAASAVLPKSTAQRMQNELPLCTLRTIPEAGHAVMLDNPADFVAHVRHFVLHLQGSPARGPILT